jgi:metallophosphoesterase (TIGR00282 family)
VNPGKGVISINIKKDLTVTVINIQGRSFLPPIDCPFHTVDEILRKASEKFQICVVDFHAESTAEKQALAWYLDGRVSAVIGTHTHVQTADERILPNGTGFITDAGMTGPFDSVIGMNKEKAIQRFVHQTPTFFKVGKGNMRFNGVILEIDEKNYKTNIIKRLNFAQMEYHGRKTN